MHLWTPRLLLAAIVATAAVMLPAVEGTRGRDRFRLEFDFASSVAGDLTLERDSGLGFGALSTVPLADPAVRDGLQPYRVLLPNGRHARWRLHLPAGSEFSLSKVRVVDARAGREDPITLSEAATVTGAAIETLQADLLAGRATADAVPQIVIDRDGPGLLLFDGDELRRMLGAWLVLGGLALLVVWGLDEALKDRMAGEAMLAWGRHRPVSAVLAVSLAGSLAATYPLFLGKSVVTPRNGPASFLYEVAPIGYGFRDTGVEVGRGSDVAAMMWTVLPYRKVQMRALAEGEFPWWNRYNQLGLPLWGQGQSFLLDPIHLVSLLWSDIALGTDMKFVLARFVFAAGVGLAALAATVSWWAASLIALACVFDGHFVGWLNHPAAFSLTYAPWILCGYFLLVRADTPWRRAGAGSLIAVASALLIYASPPKEAFALELCAHVTGTVAVLAGSRRGDRLRAAGRVVLAGCAAVLLSAPGWLVFIDTLDRMATVYDLPSATLADSTALMTFLVGAVSSRHVLAAVSPVVSAFAAIGLLSPAGMPASVVGSVAGAATGLALAVGLVPAETLVTLPLVANIVRIGEVFLNSASVPLLMLAAWGLQQARERPLIQAPGVWPILRLIAFTTAMAGLAYLVVVTGDYTSPFIGLSLASLPAAFGLPIFLGVSRPRPRVLPAAAFVLLTLLLLAPGGLHLDTGVPALDRLLVQPRGREQLDRASPVIERLQSAAEPFRIVPAGLVVPGGLPGLFGLEGVTGGDALWMVELNDLAFRFQASRFPWSFLASTSGPDLLRLGPLMDLFNVRYIVASDPMAGSADPLRITERPTAWPRAYFVDRVEVLDGPREFARRLAADTSTPFATVRAADLASTSIAASMLGTATTSVRANDYKLSQNATSFTVRTPSAGVAVLLESYLSGDFVVDLNGQPARYFRVNHLMRGVLIPEAGDWTVTFRYRPARLTLALWLGAGGAILIALLWIGPLLRPGSLEENPDARSRVPWKRDAW